MTPTIRMNALVAVVILILASVLGGCSQQQGGSDEGAHQAAGEFERGPHRGRMLRSGTFAVELTIFETNVPPRFHVYAYENGKPLPPKDVSLSIGLKRLGGKVDRFSFKPSGGFLAGDGIVTEPHSFDVSVAAVFGGKTHKWSYPSYEGRTIIADSAAAEAGIKTEKAGPARIRSRLDLLGAIDFATGAHAELRPRFPGRVLGVSANVGDRVSAGQSLAQIESNESLQPYSIVSPLDGVVLARSLNAGDVTSDGVAFEVGDLSRLSAQFRVFGQDAAHVKTGGRVEIETMEGERIGEGAVLSVSPRMDPATQSSLARASLTPVAGKVQPGSQVIVAVVKDESDVSLAVRTDAIQQFRDFEVVFAKVGSTYEVRMLEIGRRTKEWTEVLGGLEPGEEYVSENSYLIKADIEKSGASHDH